MARPWREIPESEPEDDTTSVPPALQRVRSALPAELRSRLRSARELDRTLRDEEEEHPPLVTAVPALDRLLDGGLPRGHLVELVGGRTSGRFSALLSALAAATGTGESAALIDLGDALDPAMAAALGCDLERLLWVRPKDLKEALAGTEMLIGAGFSLVVLDLGHPPVRGGRGVEAGWLRLARTARSHGSALLVGSPYRVSGTAASAVLKASRPRTLWQGGEGSPWLLGGLSARIEVEKHRRRLPGQSEGMMLAAAEAPPAPRVETPQSITTNLPGARTAGRLLRETTDERPDQTWEPLRAVGGG